MTSSSDREMAWSKTLFGNRHMIRVADTIADAGLMFTARELEESTNLAPSTVHRLLADLSSVGLVERMPREAGERCQRYARHQHPFWQTATRLSDEANRLAGWPGHADGSVATPARREGGS